MAHYQMLQFLKKNGTPYEEMPAYYRFGGLVKKKQIMKSTFNPVLKANVDAVRSVVSSTPGKLLLEVESAQDLLLSKTISLDSKINDKFEILESDKKPFFYPKDVKIKSEQ